MNEIEEGSLRSEAFGGVVGELDTLRERVAEHFRKKWDYSETSRERLLNTADEAIEALTPELNALRSRLHDLDRAIEEELAYRDANAEWADKLAYAVAPTSVIGEHTSANNPWQNALEILEYCGYLAILPVDRSVPRATSEASQEEAQP